MYLLAFTRPPPPRLSPTPCRPSCQFSSSQCFYQWPRLSVSSNQCTLCCAGIEKLKLPRRIIFFGLLSVCACVVFCYRVSISLDTKCCSHPDLSRHACLVGFMWYEQAYSSQLFDQKYGNSLKVGGSHNEDFGDSVRRGCKAGHSIAISRCDIADFVWPGISPVEHREVKSLLVVVLVFLLQAHRKLYQFTVFRCSGRHCLLVDGSVGFKFMDENVASALARGKKSG